MRFDDLTNPLTWLLVSSVSIVLATNVCWVAVRKRMGDRAFHGGTLAAAGWLTLGLFYLLLPFLALQRGVLSPYAFGLAEIAWPATLSNGMVLAGLIVAGLLFGWFLYRRARLEENPTGETPGSDLQAPERPPGQLARVLAVIRAPFDAALAQWHWTFYRAAVAGWLMLPLSFPSAPVADRLLLGLQDEPLYWGAWLGLTVAAVEWVLNPFARARFRRPGEREASLRRAALAVATTGLFVLTRNFWLCLAVHVVVETLAAAWFPLLLPAPVKSD
jgi:hypothetical protein